MLVYKATNKRTGQAYVGATIRTLCKRIQCHRYAAKRDPRPFARAIADYGTEGFSWEVLRHCSTLAEMHAEEVKAIEAHRTRLEQGGYNACAGGAGVLGFKQYQHARDAIAQANERRPRIHIPGRGKFKFSRDDEPVIRARRDAGERLEDIARDYAGSKNALCQALKRWAAA